MDEREGVSDAPPVGTPLEAQAPKTPPSALVPLVKTLPQRQLEPIPCPGSNEKKLTCGSNLLSYPEANFCLKCGYSLTPYLKDNIAASLKMIASGKDKQHSGPEMSDDKEVDPQPPVKESKEPVSSEADKSTCKNTYLAEKNTGSFGREIQLTVGDITPDEKPSSGSSWSDGKTGVCKISSDTTRQERNFGTDMQIISDEKTQTSATPLEANSSGGKEDANQTPNDAVIEEKSDRPEKPSPDANKNDHRRKDSTGAVFSDNVSENEKQNSDSYKENINLIQRGHFRNKKNEEPKNYIEPSNTSAKKEKKSDLVAVYFKAVISKDFHLDLTQDDKVYLTFRHSFLGGWEKKWPLEFHSSVGASGKYLVMKSRIRIRREALQNRFLYKYVVKRRDKPYFEYPYWTKSTHNNDTNRVLFIPSEHWRSKEKDTWYQVDCMVYPTPGSGPITVLKDTFGVTDKRRNEEAQLALESLLPDWKHLWSRNTPAEQFLKHILNAYNSAVKYFVKPYVAEEWTLKQALSNHLISCSSKLATANTDFENNYSLVTAVCIVYVLIEFEVKLDRSFASKIFEALLIKKQSDGKYPEFEILEEYHFSFETKKIAGYIEKFMNTMARNAIPEWVLAIPLLHFLYDETRPYKNIGHSSKHRNEQWWGTTRLNSIISEFLRASEHPMQIDRYLEKLQPLFEMDKLLPRTLTAVAGLENLSYLTEVAPLYPEAYIAALYFHSLHLKSYNDETQTFQLFEKVMSKLNCIISEILDKSPQTREAYYSCVFHGIMLSKISIDLIEQVCIKVPGLIQFRIIVASAQLVASCLSYVVTLTKWGQQPEQQSRLEIKPMKDDPVNLENMNLANILENFLGRMCYYRFITDAPPLTFRDPREIELLGDLLSLQWCDSSTGSFLYSRIYQFLESRIDNVAKVWPRRIIEVFCTHPLTGDIAECFSKKAFEALEKNVDSNVNFLFDLDTNDVAKGKLERMLSCSFRKNWIKTQKSSPLHQILSWTSFVRYVGLYYKTVHRRSGRETFVPFDTECIQSIEGGISLFDDALHKLSTGDITIQDLNTLVTHKEVAKKMLVTMEKASEPSQESVGSEGSMCIADPETLDRALHIRNTEVREFQDTKQSLGNFINCCNVIFTDKSVELNTIAEKIQRDDSRLKLTEICRPVNIRAASVDVSEISYFELPPGMETVLKSMDSVRRSVVFQNLWTTKGSGIAQTDRTDVSIKEILSSVWEPANTEFVHVRRMLQDGSMPFEAVDEIFSVFKREKELKVELEIILGDPCTTEKRLKQILELRVLHQYRRGAQIMLNVKDRFGLIGDFSTVEILAEDIDQKQRLDNIDESLVRAGKVLEKITPEKEKAIDVFVKCKDLVQWLKKTVSGGPKEVKVLVDLAMITAEGQGDWEVDKVSCLHAAVTGYAPLIYELYDKMGFDEFIKLCESVWKALEMDPKLPKKLEDINRNLSWLKNIKESHGSVEMNVISQVQNINARGIFQVGRLTDTKTMTKDNVVKLVVPMEGEERFKPYTVSTLMDVQSKLMLVAGKGEKQHTEEINRFVAIYEGISRLADAYLKICASGCILFEKWKCTFYCDVGRKVVVNIDILGLRNGQQLAGESQAEKDVVDYIIDMCRFIEECLDDWNREIAAKRTEFCGLNHFTTAQLVILRNEMAKLAFSEGPASDRIYHMLDTIRKQSTEEIVINAIEEVKKSILEEKQAESNTEEPDGDSHTTLEDVDNKSDCEERVEEDGAKDFVEQIENMGIPRKWAIKALEIYTTEDIDEAMIWCMEKFEEESSGTSDSASDDEEIMPQSSLTTITGVLVDEALSTSGSLKSQLSALWTGYLRKVDTSALDYLSLEHLGRILTELSSENQPINRPLPDFCTLGKPNLLVCNERDIPRACLSLYMYERGRELPLPGGDEVLYCTPDTTVEEVDLLFHRAFEDQDGKIFCLMAADLLPHDVSQKAEECFDSLTINRKELDNTGYRLVMICSRENEDKAHMVAAYDRYRIPHPFIYTIPEVCGYLQHHYRRPINTQPWPAAACDPENFCVRLVKSQRAGEGKTHYVRKFRRDVTDQAQTLGVATGSISIPLLRRRVDISEVTGMLLEHITSPEDRTARVIHVDVGHDVLENLDVLLFNLLILGRLTDRNGYVWKRSVQDMYLVEAIPLIDASPSKFLQTGPQTGVRYVHHVIGLLPTTICWSPSDSLDILSDMELAVEQRYPEDRINRRTDQCMDQQQFSSETFQRPYQYLERFDSKHDFKGLDASVTMGTMVDCLTILTRYCGLRDPSWSELRNFVCFLNVQLLACEHSIFCHMPEDLPGFLLFVVRFMIQMSRDFATRSLRMSEESPGLEPGFADNAEGDAEIQEYQLKKRWETSPHPYVFFNQDQVTMTFLGFYVQRGTGNILDPRSNQILERGVMPDALQHGLYRQNKNLLNENFDSLPRNDKILKMCYVMGINDENIHDPDDSYELTADNVKKILAIYMRFRCGIPVVIMGETGCGKTRLIKFMCDLQKPPRTDETQPEIKNMVLVKVHGGTTETDIERKVDQAIELARQNRDRFRGVSHNIDTVLFFDEANTTEAIGLIKEIMCDGSIRGKAIDKGCGLRVIAACNPYRKHTDEMIERLEQAGLGYHVESHQTQDKLGRIPMRQLVYRVQPLPRSMLPLVWDFGQLSTNVEEMYIMQMVLKHVSKCDDGNPTEEKLENIDGQNKVISCVLAASQEFMRQQSDECSFVSLRDVERALSVMLWFYRHREYIFTRIDEEGIKDKNYQPPNDVTRCLILALGVCYHACLKKRDEYRQFVSTKFQQPCILPHGPKSILIEIERCQDLFLDQVNLGNNIAKNKALKENLFMMVVCIELRIPLFLVGKPGSSKSLAKTIVADAMQGDKAHHELFQNFKEVHMVSYQCSPLSTPDGIVGTFKQCAQFQKDKDLHTFVSVVVLDEIGLAEDSPLMPLKTLHPLLEDGCEGDEESEVHKKVAFIGISNWALDPAKMNRGIHVQREVPDLKELTESAKGICDSEKPVLLRVAPLFKPMAESYLEIYKKTGETKEFFGLRDFYSLVKMIFGFSKRSDMTPTWHEVKHAVMRNFGGLDSIKPVEVFAKKLPSLNQNAQLLDTDPDCSSSSLIKGGLHGDGLESETRYLLILTENYAALSLLEKYLLNEENTITIFGSSFPRDQEYTQVCRNINRIKVCMETGKTVVLLNLDNLYESLYDALNQYYVYLGDERFVDLGLGNQRVKCRVHKDFRLVVVAEKSVVYEKFPIPLINRLEKHFLAISTILSDTQIQVATRLNQWTESFVASTTTHIQRRAEKLKPGDVFVGYNADTAASVILQICEDIGIRKENWEPGTDDKVFELAKDILLQCATPDGLMRLSQSGLRQEEEDLQNRYFTLQTHFSLEQFLLHEVNQEKARNGVLAQVTTYSRLLSKQNAKEIGKKLNISHRNVQLEMLQAFDNEQQFTKKLTSFFSVEESQTDRLMLLLCDSGDRYGNLLACARNIIWDKYRENETSMERSNIRAHLVLIIQLPRVRGGQFVGFEGGRWTSYHIDELLLNEFNMPHIKFLKGKTISDLLRETGSRATGGDEASVKDSEKDSAFVESLNTEVTEEAPFTSDDETSTGCLEYDPNKAEEVRPCDIILQEREAYQSEEKYQDLPIEGTLDFNKLLLNCIHSATSLIKDSADGDRKTRRLRMLIELLSAESAHSVSLMQTIQKRVRLLQEDKEQSAGHHITDWLVKEVASNEKMSQAGTFRRSFWYALENRVTLLLAGLLAYADTNSNLDIIERAITESDVMMVQLWVEILSSPEACELRYHDLRSATEHIELTEFTVQCSGYNKKMFQAEFPFSWILKNVTDSLVNKREGTKSDKENVKFLCDLLEKTPIGRILSACNDPEFKEKLIQFYLHDFVWMVCKIDHQVEHQLIARALWCAAQELAKAEPENILPGCTASIPGIHIAFLRIHGRLQLFHQTVQIMPESLERLNQAQQGKLNPLFTANEMTLDVQALYCLLEMLDANKDTFLSETVRKRWTAVVDRCQPVIHMIFSTVDREELISDTYGEVSLRAVTSARHLWNRIQIVRLFIKHVCVGEEDVEEISIKKIAALWKSLGERCDIKSYESFRKVEMILQLCNQAVTESFYGKHNKCTHCKGEMSDPVQLPCKDVFCMTCVIQFPLLGTDHCPTCQKNIPSDFKPTPMKENKEKVVRHNAYKGRCNSFFMELVSTMSFNGNATVGEEIIKTLMGYITKDKDGVSSGRRQTRQMSVFKDCIDPTPVVRSFLLQLLLRSNNDNVHEYLQIYFENGKQVSSQKEDLIELSLLVVHCFENSYTSEHSQMQPWDSMNQTKALMEEALAGFKSEDILERLIAIAQTRFSFSMMAKWLYHSIEKRGKKLLHPLEIQRVFKSAEEICEYCGFKWPRLYLLKILSRKYGIEYVRTVAERNPWILPPDIRNMQVEAGQDRYLVCGENYRLLRETVAKTVISKDIKCFKETFKNIKEKVPQKARLLMLAIHREVTMANHSQDNNQRPTQEALESLLQLIQTERLYQDREFAEAIIRNQFGVHAPMLNVSPETPSSVLDTVELLHHFIVAMRSAPNDVLLVPLQRLMAQPEASRGSFLPTMPEDNLAEIHAALLAARGHGGDHNPVLYQCPNGHPYVVGACGRPMEIKSCRACGVNIGGTNHTAVYGNTTIHNVTDRTQPGHILGDPGQRTDNPVPDRDLSPTSSATIRLLLHLAMLAAANSKTQAVAGLIHPAVQDVPGFILQHISQDLQVLTTALARSKDDIILYMHILLDRIGKHHITGKPRGIPTTWNNKQERRDWETIFQRNYLTPLLDGLNNRLNNTNAELMMDDRLGANPLLRIMYEVDAERAPPVTMETVEMAPAMWRYEEMIDVHNVRVKLNELVGRTGDRGDGEKPCQLLRQFLKQYGDLSLLRLLPNIGRLQRILIQRFSRNIDSSEALALTIDKALIKLGRESVQQRDEVERLIQDFAYAWERIKEHLKDVSIGGMKVDPEYRRHKIDPSKTKLAMLLPSWKGMGLCPLTVIHYLVEVHNDFMEQYAQIRHIRLDTIVNINDATMAHVVAFHPDGDLHPIILANCSYNLTIGSQTSPEYNFQGMERQIEERFICGRPRISPPNEVIIYREDSTTAVVFERLENSIVQEVLPPGVHQQVQHEQMTLPDLCEYLALLDTAIGFLVSVGGQADDNLNTFMVDILKMDTDNVRGNIFHCKLSQVKNLWLLLAHERAKRMTLSGQDPFDGVDNKYLEPVPESRFSVPGTKGQQTTCREILERTLENIPLESFMQSLFDAITLALVVTSQPDHEEGATDNTTQPLGYVLSEYINQTDGREIPALEKEERFPRDVHVSHAISVWRLGLEVMLRHNPLM